MDDRHRFLLLEKYVDRAAFKAHQATKHFTDVGVNQIRPLLDDRSVEIVDT
ncbi:MAG: antibiotic biosynthesis monooxygenase [Acidimicrobiia bacterium]|nr:antibiotic biosynthesis monooxygenase [Acidimicrobiia bacterium]